TGNTPPTASANPLIVGRTSLTNAQYWTGAIDEVRIWSVMRTAQQIADSYNARLSGSEPGLVAYWRFDEGAGQVLHDSSTNGHDALLGSSAQADGADPTWV